MLVMHGASYLARLINWPFLSLQPIKTYLSIFQARPFLVSLDHFFVQNWSGRTVFTWTMFSVTGPAIDTLYNQNYWRTLYLVNYSKNAIDRFLNWWSVAQLALIRCQGTHLSITTKVGILRAVIQILVSIFMALLWINSRLQWEGSLRRQQQSCIARPFFTGRLSIRDYKRPFGMGAYNF